MALQAKIEKAATVGSARLVSVRNEFATQWARFVTAAGGAPTPLTTTLREEHYPYWARGVERGFTLHRVDLLAAGDGESLTVSWTAGALRRRTAPVPVVSCVVDDAGLAPGMAARSSSRPDLYEPHERPASRWTAHRFVQSQMRYILTLAVARTLADPTVRGWADAAG